MVRNSPGELAALRSDATLVSEALAGSREAFRAIVERYQTLLCSVAYNATGNLNRSEDLAQEAFVTAWSRLGSLREPDKLRSWLCGIVRHGIQHHRRDERQEPVCDAGPIELAHDIPAPDALPSEQAVTREEEALLWRALEHIPPLYREPLILFYREHQSVEQVAAALELSPDAAKQRLSRGRKLLQEEVHALVENTLRRSAPGRAFSGVVITLLPAAAGPVASVGLAKGATAKSGWLAAWLMPLAPFLGIGAGIVAQCLVVRDFTADPRRRRRWTAAIAAAWIGYVVLAAAGEAMVRAVASDWTSRDRFVAVVCYWWLFVGATLGLQFAAIRRFRHERVGPLPSWRMQRGTIVALGIGLHLALFGALMTLAWRWADATGLGVSTGALVVLCVHSVWRLQGRGVDGAAILREVGSHTALAGGTILLILALRADVWVAAAHGLRVEEAHQALPTWLVPMLVLALAGWTMLLAAWTRGARLDR
jgi:RNA polymerase sigma factor (sigma-70 family)